MFKLVEFKTLLAEEGVVRCTFAQCRFGAIAETLTDLVGNIEGLEEFRCAITQNGGGVCPGAEDGSMLHTRRSKGRQRACSTAEASHEEAQRTQGITSQDRQQLIPNR